MGEEISPVARFFLARPSAAFSVGRFGAPENARFPIQTELNARAWGMRRGPMSGREAIRLKRGEAASVSTRERCQEMDGADGDFHHRPLCAGVLGGNGEGRFY
jgi:hypothetical protein